MVGKGMLDRFDDRIDELEAAVREIAIDITTGTFVERLSPEEVWERTGDQINLVSELIKELREYLFILKPEKVPTIQRQVADIYERLEVYKETLGAGTYAPKEGSQLSIDELRKALVEVSDFVSLCRAIKAEPSEVIGAVLSLREEKQDTYPIATAKVVALGELVKEAEASYKEMAELSSKMESNLSAIRSEYEDLLVTLRKKEE
jgi:hypothetical protein